MGQFEKGHASKGGAPRKEDSIKRQLRVIEALPPDKKFYPKTNAQVAALRIWEIAKGVKSTDRDSIKAFEVIADRIDGKPKQEIEMSGAVETNPIAEALKRLREEKNEN